MITVTLPTRSLERRSTAGSVMLLVLVFGSVFFTVLVALSGFVLEQNHAQEITREKSEAFSIAEAGLEYYRWFLSHFPGNTQNNTGHNGPFTVTYADPEGGTVGSYTLAITGNVACGVVQSIDVTSTGVPADAPNVSSTLWARYAQPSVARYLGVYNASVWFGPGPLYGPIHDNGGIRMDGAPNAPITSSVSSWYCDSSFGCHPGQTEPGVFGGGTNSNFWNYPTPQVDFTAIASNFSTLKSIAQTSGLYFPPISSKKNAHVGYHLVFNGDGTVTVSTVTAVDAGTRSIPADGTSGVFTPDYTRILSETTLGTYTVPTNCGLIFVEDNAWIEGTVSGKVTVVAANVTSPGVYPNIVLPNNITYATYDGTSGLTAIASHDVLISPDAPSNLTLDGIFVAQSGVFGSNLYNCNTPSFANKSTLTMLGTTVSALRPVTYWTYNGGPGCSNYSGYPNGTATFDRQNSTNPPPFTPVTSTQWQFVDWRQE